MRSLRLNRSFVFSFLALAVLSGWVYAQPNVCKSVSTELEPGCANEYREFKELTTSKLWGRVEYPITGELAYPVYVAIYKIRKDERKENSYNLVKFREPTIIIQANEKGEFCHPGLAEGYYVVKFGYHEPGFNCSWIKVRILKSSPEIRVKGEISIGT